MKYGEAATINAPKKAASLLVVSSLHSAYMPVIAKPVCAIEPYRKIK